MDGMGYAGLTSEWGLDAGRVMVEPSDDLYGSPLRVAEAAEISIGTALAAVAALHERRSGERATAILDARHAVAAFQSEALLRLEPGVLGGPSRLPAANYRTADGWIRLETNRQRHVDPVVHLLGVQPEPPAVARAAARWTTAELEHAVIDAGGIASRLRTREEFLTHPQRVAILDRPVVDITTGQAAEGAARLARGRVLEGIRVLDLTWVIAGPVAGRFLASFGADVIRVDSPLDDNPMLEIETGFGKRRTRIDLKSESGRERFDDLVRGTDVVLHGFRPGALDSLGYSEAHLRELAPGLIIGRISAFSERGPWSGRRGFDSLVQVANGIAHTCGFDAEMGPSRLPAQALDHASGYLLAAGVVAGVDRLLQSGRVSAVAVSLARTAEWLVDLGVRHGTPPPGHPLEVADLLDTWRDTAWGTVRHLRPVGRIGDRAATWSHPAVPPTDDAVAWYPGVDRT